MRPRKMPCGICRIRGRILSRKRLPIRPPILGNRSARYAGTAIPTATTGPAADNHLSFLDNPARPRNPGVHDG